MGKKPAASKTFGEEWKTIPPPLKMLNGKVPAMKFIFSLLLSAYLAGNLLASPATGPSVGEPSRQIAFKVEKLECCLVNGVGCGHLLAPTLAKLDAIDGVARSYSNWTGTVLLVSVKPAADARSVAERVQAALVADQQQPTRIGDKELPALLSKEQWRGVDRIAELTSYEFKTVAKTRATAYAENEKLDQGKREKLLGFVDELWDKAADGMGQPKPDQTYPEYWRRRCDNFVTIYLAKAREVLTPEQIATLKRQYDERGK